MTVIGTKTRFCFNAFHVKSDLVLVELKDTHIFFGHRSEIKKTNMTVLGNRFMLILNR